MSRERNVSILASRAAPYMTKTKPSLLIPFNGEFPILKNYEISDYNEAVQGTEIIDELPKEFQTALMRGNQIGLMVGWFRDYLENESIGEEEFMKLSNSEKSSILIKWMEKERIPMSKLNIG